MENYLSDLVHSDENTEAKKCSEGGWLAHKGDVPPPPCSKLKDCKLFRKNWMRILPITS